MMKSEKIDAKNPSYWAIQSSIGCLIGCGILCHITSLPVRHRRPESRGLPVPPISSRRQSRATGILPLNPTSRRCADSPFTTISGPNSDYSLIDHIQDTSTLLPTALLEDLGKYELVNEFFETLTVSEKEILTRRFGLDDTSRQTLDTIGTSFGVTRERIRRIEAKSLEKLRKMVVTDEEGG